MKDNSKDKGWIIPVLIWYLLCCLLLAAGICWMTGCSPKIIERVETKVEYRDRIVHDTATFEVPVEVEKIVTRDTISHLENTWAKSDAVVSQGFLHHSLESKPQTVYVPVEVHVTDTLWKESEVITEIKEVEQPLSWWKQMKVNTWGWLLAVVLGLLVYVFRKPLLTLIKTLI